MSLPYLPSILKGVVTRVNTVLSTRATDPFNVFFDNGIYSQVGKDLSATNFPLGWLVMNFPEDRGGEIGIFAIATVQMIFCQPTNPDYSQADREANVFFNRLIPFYEEFMNQLSVEKMLLNPAKDQIKHTRILRPYWGGGDVNGPGSENLFKQYMDAISVTNLKLKIKFC